MQGDAHESLVAAVGADAAPSSEIDFGGVVQAVLATGCGAPWDSKRPQRDPPLKRWVISHVAETAPEAEIRDNPAGSVFRRADV